MTTAQQTMPASDQASVYCRFPRAAVIIMCFTVGLIYGSGTILFTALPTVADELDANQTQLQWVTGVYPLVIAALLMPGGAFVDRVGRKVGAILGLAIASTCFVAASQCSDARLVILFMGFAGVGGAMSFPATLATITAVLPADRRGPAVAIWSVSLFMGGMIGTMAGGVAQWLAFQWLLIIPAGIGFALVIPALLLVPESRDRDNAHIDLRGAALAALAVGLFVYGMTEAPTKGWANPHSMLAWLGAIFGVFFVWSQLVAKRPMLDVRLFRDGRFSSGSLVNMLSWFLAYGYFFTAVQYRAYTLGYSPLDVGLSLIPAGLLVFPLAIAGPRLARRYGSRIVMIAGLLVLAGGSVGVALAAPTQQLLLVVSFEAIMLGGLALLGGPATECILDALPPSKHGVASAVNDITRQLGVALGVALLGSLFNAVYRADVVSGDLDASADIREATKDSAAEGLRLIADLPEAAKASQSAAVEHAVAFAFSAAMLAAALIVAISAIAVWRRCPRDAGKVVASVPVVDECVGSGLDEISAELDELARRYRELLGRMEEQRAELTSRVRALELHEERARLACVRAQNEHAELLYVLSQELTSSLPHAADEFERWPDFVDPIAAPLQLRE